MRRSPLQHVPALALIAIAVILNGCGKGAGPTTPAGGAVTQDVADDLALQAVVSADNVSAEITTSVSSVPGGGPAAFGLTRTEHALWDTTFTRTTATGDTIWFAATRTFYTSGGTVLPGYGPLAAKLVLTSRVYGTATTDRDTASIGHSGSLELTGIQPADPAFVFNGDALDTLQNSFRSYDGTVTRHFYWQSALHLADVTFARPVTDPFPESGTLTWVVSADRLRSNDRGDVERHFDATVTVTFDGTSTPEIVVNGRFRYHWNLVTGLIVRA